MLRNKYNCKCQILLAAMFVNWTEQWHFELNFTGEKMQPLTSYKRIAQ